jgi:hypothetical protein
MKEVYFWYGWKKEEKESENLLGSLLRNKYRVILKFLRALVLGPP